MTTPKSQDVLGRNRARVLLDTNNSAISSRADSILSILEAGEGTTYIRDEIDHVLHNHAGLATDWRELRKFQSIKDKLAYVVGYRYGEAMNTAGLGGTITVDEEKLRTELKDAIKELETRIFNQSDFDESWILRSAAVNRFECKLNETEKQSLNGMSTTLQKLAQDSGYQTLASSLHAHFESNAQQIMKLVEATNMLIKAGVSVDEKVIKGIDTMGEKIKPLKELDKHYKHMQKMLNMLHDIAKRGYTSMISHAQQRKLVAVLADLGKKEQDFIIDPNKSVGEEKYDAYLQQMLYDLKHGDQDKYREVISKHNLTQNEFERYFYSYYGFKGIEKARGGFDNMKRQVFGTRLPDFEKDVNSWRGHARDRILAEHATMHMGPDHRLVMTDDQYEFIDSYFKKFPDLFYANPRDSQRDVNANRQDQYIRMREITSALIRRKCPQIVSLHSNAIMRTIQKMMSRAGGAIKALFEQWRGFQDWRHFDAADFFALIIMGQNELKNEMFYQTEDKFAPKKRGRLERITTTLSRTEFMRSGAVKAMAPTFHTIMRTGETAIKKTLQGVSYVARPVARKAIELSGRFGGYVSGGLEKKTSQYNDWLAKKKFSWRKLPLYPTWLGTKLIEKGLGTAKDIAEWTEKSGSKGPDKLDEAVQKGYAGTVSWIKESSQDNEVKYMYQGLSKTLNGVSRFLGNTAANIGERAEDKRDTHQKRGVLSAFYEAAAGESELIDMMQSGDLAEMLNLKERGPYLFDYDGRVQMLDKDGKPEASIDNDKKSIVDGLEKQMKLLKQQSQEQLNADIKQLQDLYSNSSSSDDAIHRATAMVDFHTGSDADIGLISQEFINLLPHIKDSKLTAWKHGDIGGVLTRILDNIDGNATATPPIASLLNNYESKKSLAATDIRNKKDELKDAESQITRENDRKSDIMSTKGWRNTLMTEYNAAETIVLAQQKRKQRLEDEIKNLQLESNLSSPMISLLKRVRGVVVSLQTLNNNINTALTATPVDEDLAKRHIKSMTELIKNAHLLLKQVPESTKQDPLEEVKKILSKSGVDEKTKLDLLAELTK